MTSYVTYGDGVFYEMTDYVNDILSMVLVLMLLVASTNPDMVVSDS